jgi:putative endonuclease
VATTVSLGASAEAVATRVLVAHGYTIVERNFRCVAGELDIVARDAEVLVFVEVRSRADAEHGDAAEMVDRRKRRQVARVAMQYIGERNPVFARSRFDVVAITGDDAQLIKDAWRL